MQSEQPPTPEDIPGLPTPDPGMNWRALNRYRADQRGPDFYFSCLKYAQALWRKRLPARAILCLDRAWGSDLSGTEPELASWPLPYRPLVYILQHTPQDAFLGNPRVHFQHYADRLREPRREQRKWRSWACWALTRATSPDFPGDPRHAVAEPSVEEIAEQLRAHGHSGEVDLWRSAFPS